MKTNTTQKRRPKELISVGVVLAAIVISLMMQGEAQAWWVGSVAFPYEAPDGKTWACVPIQYGYSVPGGLVWYCHCYYCINNNGVWDVVSVGDYWFFYDFQSGKMTLLWRGGW